MGGQKDASRQEEFRHPRRLPVGAGYGEIKKVIAVSIVYFDLGKGEDYIYVGQTKFKGLHTDT
jgi:hypothetical protein